MTDWALKANPAISLALPAVLLFALTKLLWFPVPSLMIAPRHVLQCALLCHGPMLKM